MRVTSTTPLQALSFLNDPLIHQQSQRFAQRLLAERPNDRWRIDRAIQLSLGPPAASAEIEDSLRFLAAITESLRVADSDSEQLPWQAWATFTRALLRLNELVYLD